MKHDAVHRFLSRLQQHTVLKSEELDGFVALLGETETIPPHSNIVRREASAELTSLVLEGLLVRTCDTRSGGQQIAGLYVPGEMPDVSAVMMPALTVTLSTVSAAAKIIRVSRSSLCALLCQFPALVEAFWRETIIEAVIAMQWTVNIGQRNAGSRLAHLFAEIAVRLGAVNGNSFGFRLPMTQSEMGEATGMSTVHVNRMLKALRDANLVQVAGSEIAVQDWQALTEFAEFDSGYLSHERPQRLLAKT